MARKIVKKNTKINKKAESNSSESSNITSESSSESKSVSENELSESQIEDSESLDSKVTNNENVDKAKEIIDEVDETSSEEDVIKEGLEESNKEGLEESDTESGSKNNDADDEIERTIFIKGLDYDITEESLRSEVEKIGLVGRINVPKTHDGRRNKGFAYIEFKKQEDATKLLKLNEQEFMGRKVIVDKAKPKTNYMLYTIYVKNLGFNTTRVEILEYFKKFGKVHNVSLPIDTENEGRNKGYCFIEYLDESIARNVVNNKHIINGRSLFLNFGQKNEKRNEKRSNDRLYGRRDTNTDHRRFNDGNKNNRRDDRSKDNRGNSENDRFYKKND